MGIKRFREELEEDYETVATANCLMLLSKVGEEANFKASSAVKEGGERLFECKTCKKQFHSFQALGGHRASHKKLRLMPSDLILHQALPAKPKMHKCSICGLEFPLGQALGGHMRRHRAADMDGEKLDRSGTKVAVPILMRSNSSCKRIFGFEYGLDLNLTPDENDSKRRNIPPLLDFLHLVA